MIACIGVVRRVLISLLVISFFCAASGKTERGYPIPNIQSMALSPVTVKLLKIGLGLMVIHTVSMNLLHVDAQVVVDESSLKLMSESDALEWPILTMSFDEEEGEGGRRSLFWQRMKYYISYGALSANRIPCPPRSGRSYYTPNCHKARGPVHPYTRGCSIITRCRR